MMAFPESKKGPEVAISARSYFKPLGQRKYDVANVELASGLPIAIRAFENKVQVGFSDNEKVIPFCSLHVCINGANGMDVLL